MENLKKIVTVCVLWVLILMITYFTFFQKGYIVSWVFMALFTISIALLIIALLLTLFILILMSITNQNNYKIKKYLGTQFVWLCFSVVALGLQTQFSEFFTYTPDNGETALIESVELNGTTQYISIRGEDLSNPVILFLAGGPGGTQMASTREFFKDLENEYTIINWEQPGVGKSYNARHYKDLTVDVYVEDAHALTTYLKQRFQQEKIYIVGESWGSYLGVLLADIYPEDYFALIGTGQMVDFTETEIACYNLAMEIAVDRGDQRQIDALEKIGVPPIYGENVTMELATYLQYLHRHMGRNEEINHSDWDTLDTLFSPEYSVMDSVNFARGLLYTFSHVYQQLYGTNLREEHRDFEIPVYFLHGRYDVNAPVFLVEEYYEVVNAPDKELIFFEHSGHNPWIDESELFNETLRELFDLH